jgi:hypothetical protein
MKVLVACEYSGTVRDAFIAQGHDAMSCDILPTDIPGPHYEGSILDLLHLQWDLMIGHPPCTYLTNSGVRWLKTDPTRWFDLNDGAAFFKALWTANIPHIALENPIPHKYAIERIGAKYDQLVQPYHFGHREQKATCLWLKGLPPLVHTNNVKVETMALPKAKRNKMFYLPPSADRAKLRSKTYQGIADAMASQWGNDQ